MARVLFGIRIDHEFTLENLDFRGLQIKMNRIRDVQKMMYRTFPRNKMHGVDRRVIDAIPQEERDRIVALVCRLLSTPTPGCAWANAPLRSSEDSGSCARTPCQP